MGKPIEFLKQHVYCIIASLTLLVLFISLLISGGRHKKFAEYRQELCTILNNENESQRYEELKLLAKKVGAGYVNTKVVCSDTRKIGTATVTDIRQNPISESELVLNINNALQTEMMIDMCNTAARNFWLALIASIAAAMSAFAAWRAIVIKK
jgi:hypothetical protein